jgi:hypothetical protein
LARNAVSVITIATNAVVILVGGTMFLSSLTAKIDAIGKRIDTVDARLSNRIVVVNEKLLERTVDPYTGTEAGKDADNLLSTFMLRDERIEYNRAALERMSVSMSRVEALLASNQAVLVDLRSTLSAMPPEWLLNDVRELKRQAHEHNTAR